jgi:outer membrane autotransporter protein
MRCASFWPVAAIESAFALAPLDKDEKPQRGGGGVSALAPLDSDGKPQRGGGASADPADPFERWGFFINGDIDIGRQSAVDTQTGFKLTSKGVTIGTDYRFTGNNVLGVALGYLRADTDLNGGAGSADADGYSVSLYGSYVPVQNAYIDGIVNFGHNKYDSQRGVGVTYNSNTSGDQWGLALSGGYAFNQGPLAMTPYARVEYIDAKVDGFSESGGVGALVVGEQRIKATTLTVGGQVSYAISTSWGVLIPNGRVEFQHVASRSANAVEVGIVNVPGSTPIIILGDDRNFGTFAAGVSAVFPKGVGAFFNYEQLFGKDNFSNQRYTLGLRLEF